MASHFGILTTLASIQAGLLTAVVISPPPNPVNPLAVGMIGALGVFSTLHAFRAAALEAADRSAANRPDTQPSAAAENKPGVGG